MSEDDIRSSFGAMPEAIEQLRRGPRAMTPEHKAKMAEGRIAAAARRTAAAEQQVAATSRGRPASRPAPAPMPREARPAGNPEVEDFERLLKSIETGDLTVSRDVRGQTATTFDVPEQGKRPGWDYCWWPFKIVGEEIDASVIVEYARGGWIEVHPSHFPSLVPRGWRRPCIERQGARLYMRPMRLSDEARAETERHAYEQKANRLAAAEAGDTGREFARRDPRAGGISAKVEPLM